MTVLPVSEEEMNISFVSYLLRVLFYFFLFALIPQTVSSMVPDIHVKITQKKSLHRICLHAIMISDVDADSLFRFVSNPHNDVYWRNEVVKVVFHGDTTYSEFSDLSAKMKAHEMVFIPKTEVENGIFASQTIGQQDFFQCVYRQVLKANKGSQFTYIIEFDQSIIKKAKGFYPPFFLLKFYLKKTTRKYLFNLSKKFPNEP